MARRWILAGFVLVALVLGAGGILEGRGLFLAAAWTFASLPVLYLTAAAIRGGGWLGRPAAVAGAALLVVVLSGSSLVALTRCEPRVAPGADLAGCDLGGVNLAGRDLREADLTGADLTGANLRRATLDRAVLRAADLRQAALGLASFRGAELQGADLRNLDLRGVTLVDARLDGAMLDGVDLRGAELASISFVAAGLRGANLAGANLAGADLSDAVLDGVALGRATLIGARGVEDGRLATALGVGEADVGAALIEQEIRLEPRQDILDALGRACRGDGVTGTTAYPSGELHPMVILGGAGGASLDGDRAAELGWEPMAVRHAQLVACLEDQRDVQLEVCPYQGQGGFGTITRVRHEQRLLVVEASSGRTVLERSLEGSVPKPCPPTHVFLETNLNETFAGSSITFEDFESDLEGLVR